MRLDLGIKILFNKARQAVKITKFDLLDLFTFAAGKMMVMLIR